MNHLTSETIALVRSLYPYQERISLHEPVMGKLEKEYLSKCVDSTFVSSVGEYVGKFESAICNYTGVSKAIATSNGTSALHAALILAGVCPGHEVITQAMTFIATANAISYCYANPVFVDSEAETLGMCPDKLANFLKEVADVREDGFCYNKNTGARISACVPMHVFGHPCKTEKISKLCEEYRIFLIEDAAEALGSFSNGKHVGHHGKISIFSFNGNKIVTCGGGGMIVTNDNALAVHAKHLTTTAKVPHAWEFVHDEVGYNYRMPNLNASFACAQMEQLECFLLNKRETAKRYREFFAGTEYKFLDEPVNAKSNFWLNAILLPDREAKEFFLAETNQKGVMTRPLWALMPTLKMFSSNQCTDLAVAQGVFDRLVNLPSGVRTHE
jgi:perosamine synthetase